jgi:succinyl-CoA synthetase alpha subunit
MITKADAVLVQGITGRQGSFWTARMRDYGTNVVAGVTPGKGGQMVDGIPVYDSVAEAGARHDVYASVLFVPPLVAKASVEDAIAGGARLVVLLTEHIPVHDTMEILAAADEAGVRVVGPNTAGLVVPGEASLGIMPAFAANVFAPGRRMGHAGAIVTGSRGGGPSKVAALTEAGAKVIDLPSELGPVLTEALGAATPR